jgi:hypothetical protein
VIDMNETRLNTVAQLRAFLAGTLEVKFHPIRNDAERYGFITAVLGRFAYRLLRSGSANLNSAISGNSGHDAGPAV